MLESGIEKESAPEVAELPLVYSQFTAWAIPFTQVAGSVCVEIWPLAEAAKFAECLLNWV